MPNYRTAFLVSLACFLPSVNAAQVLAPCQLIDGHTAGVLPRAVYALEVRAYPNGNTVYSGSGLMLGISVGIFDRLTIGLSYGGDGVISREKPTFDPSLGALIKYRLIEESYFVPAFAIGYDHQGYGGVDDNYNGYIYKSAGFFLAASKNYLLLASVQMGLHGGIDYSLEDHSRIRWPNGYAGLDIGINEQFSFFTEYNLALNYSNTDQNPLKGFLNVGVQWAFSPQFYASLAAKDVLENRLIDDPNAPDGKKPIGWSRELKIVYIGNF
jgi:hypothetical protein